MFRPLIAVVTIASGAMLAGPAFASSETLFSTENGDDRAFTLGAYTAFETDHSLSSWGPAVGINACFDINGPMSLVLAPRLSYGVGYPNSAKLPIALRKDIPFGDGVYTSFGPYLGWGVGSATAAPGFDVGAAVDLGLSIPIGNVTFDVGGEAGYGFLNPAKSSLPFTATFKFGARL